MVETACFAISLSLLVIVPAVGWQTWAIQRCATHAEGWESGPADAEIRGEVRSARVDSSVSETRLPELNVVVEAVFRF